MASDVLIAFRDEVIARGPQATLPCNLSDSWLCRISEEIERYFAADEGDDAEFTLSLAAIVHILFAKSGGQEVTESFDKMFEYFERFRLEIALEEVRRKTDLEVEPATIETIFTDRDLPIG